MNESFDLGSLVGEFREEARDQLDRVEARLLDLEREGTLEDEARTGLLRTLHTLKGNAGMLGLSAIRDFVHALENVLKADAVEWSEPLVERLFEGEQALRAAVESAGGDRQSEVFRELTAARHRLVELDPGMDTPDESVDEEEDDVVEAPAAGDLVRVPFAKLDTLLAEVGDLLGEAAGLELEAGHGENLVIRDLAETIRRRADGLRDSVMSLRLVPLNRVVGRFHALVRRLAGQQGKEARLVVEGEGTEVDKSTADALAEPLLHLVRNAIDHGIQGPEEREAAGKPRHGTIRIRAVQSGDRVRIAVEDDGAGLDRAAIRRRAEELDLMDGATDGQTEVDQLIFEPGFSTRTDVSTVSGRGVGLDVVSQSVRELRGELSVERAEGGGTRFVLSLPLTVAIVPSLVFEAGGETLALPATYVSRTMKVTGTERLGAVEVVRSEDGLYPVADADRLFDWPAAERGEFGVLVEREGKGAVLTAQRLVDQRDLVVKAMPPYGRRPPLVSGGSVLPGGRVILVLDPAELLQRTERQTRSQAPQSPEVRESGGDRGDG